MLISASSVQHIAQCLIQLWLCLLTKLHRTTKAAFVHAWNQNVPSTKHLSPHKRKRQPTSFYPVATCAIAMNQQCKFITRNTAHVANHPTFAKTLFFLVNRSAHLLMVKFKFHGSNTTPLWRSYKIKTHMKFSAVMAIAWATEEMGSDVK